MPSNAPLGLGWPVLAMPCSAKHVLALPDHFRRFSVLGKANSLS